MSLSGRSAFALLTAVVMASSAAYGQGSFFFLNRAGDEVNARFVLPTDPPGTSSVGTNYQVQLFGGPNGAALDQLVPLDPPSTTFRGAAGTIYAGWVVGVSARVPGEEYRATVLVRVFDGPSWEAATMRFEGVYSDVYLVLDATPAVIQLGTSPLVLQPVPECRSVILALIGLGVMLLPRVPNYLMHRAPREGQTN